MDRLVGAARMAAVPLFIPLEPDRARSDPALYRLFIDTTRRAIRVKRPDLANTNLEMNNSIITGLSALQADGF